MTIQIDVHPTEETWYTWHICFSRQSTYATRTLPAGGPCTWQPFTLTQQSSTYSLPPRKSAPDSTSQPGWVAHGTRLSFSAKHNHWSSVFNPNICWWTSYINLLGSYHQYVIITFNTCSRGPTNWSLTNTDGGYNFGGPGLPHHTLRPSQPTVLYFPPKGPTRSQVNQSSITNWTKREINPNLASGTPPLDFYRSLSSKHSNY
jgi:hypothetical protein